MSVLFFLDKDYVHDGDSLAVKIMMMIIVN